MKKYSILLALFFITHFSPLPLGEGPGVRARAGEKADDVLKGLRTFTERTALPDGSFRPGIDPDYKGMSDSAYSNFAPVTYAVVLHRTFGWTLPQEAKTHEWILARQEVDGAFAHTAGTVDPKSAQGRVYNTTMALMALHGLGAKAKYDPLPIFAKVMEKDYKQLPAYSSSFFPLAYRLVGAKLPQGADAAMRGTMIQAEDGYLNDHVAATFHAVHYDKLLNEKTPKADLILKRCLNEQKPDGSWMLNPLARDRHACFDAVFMLKHLGGERADCKKAIQRAADWVLSCRNKDGGFGHYPGSPSDWDACYFHVGVLVMAGRLTPTDKLPKDAHLLGWGHLFADAQKTPLTTLFNGKDLAGWTLRGGEKNNAKSKWRVGGGAFIELDDTKRLFLSPGAGTLLNGEDGRGVDLITELQHGDCELSIQFKVPKGSNSGVYFQGQYEVQILDSFGKADKDLKFGDCGGIYNTAAPKTNVSRMPGEWQSFDVIFHAPRFDDKGKKIANAKFVKVVHNGEVIHENVEVKGPTTAALGGPERPLGPLMLQGDHGPVAFRNIKMKMIK